MSQFLDFLFDFNSLIILVHSLFSLLNFDLYLSIFTFRIIT